MTEPVHALSSPVGRALAPQMRPRRAYAGNAETNAVLLGSTGALVVGAAAFGLAPGLTLLPAIAVALPLTLLIDRLVLGPRAAARFNVAFIAGTEAATRGRYDDAERIYLELARGYRSRPWLQAFALFHCASLRATMGDFETALAMLLALDAFRGSKRHPALHAQLPRTIALFNAQLGRVAEGRRWLEIALARRNKGKFYDAYLEATLLAREGRYAEAVAAYEREWADLERAVASSSMHTLRARRAFALEKLGGREAEVDRLVAATQPSRPDELAHLTVGWPELAAFLEQRGLYRSP